MIAGMSGSTYLWIKAWHVIAVIAWYAGLFYIFRLFVYHVQQRDKPDVAATLVIMERRLMRAIMLRSRNTSTRKSARLARLSTKASVVASSSAP